MQPDSDEDERIDVELAVNSVIESKKRLARHGGKCARGSHAFLILQAARIADADYCHSIMTAA